MGTGVLSCGGGMNHLRHEVNHSAAFSAKVKSEWSCPPPPECIHGMDRENFNFL